MRLVGVLMGVFDTVNNETSTAESVYTQRTGYSIQRLSLESSLNDRFDSDLRRIEIKNGSVGGDDFVFNEAETVSSALFVYIFNEVENPSAPDREFLINENESLSGATNFTVFIPTEYSTQESLIRAWINTVLMFSTQYTIEYV